MFFVIGKKKLDIYIVKKTMSSFSSLPSFCFMSSLCPPSVHSPSPSRSPPPLSQEEKDSDSSKETLDDLFPDDQDDQAPGSKCSIFAFFPLLTGTQGFSNLDPNMKRSSWLWDLE